MKLNGTPLFELEREHEEALDARDKSVSSLRPQIGQLVRDEEKKFAEAKGELAQTKAELEKTKKDMERITGEAIEVAQGQKKRIKGEVQQREKLQKRLAAEVDERERLKKDNENSMKEREKLRKEIEDGVNERKKIEEQKAELARANVAADETVTRCEDFIMMLKQEMEERRRNASNQLAVQKNKLAEAERKIATQQALTKQAQTALREAIAAHAVIANSLQAQIVAEKDAAVKASADLEEKLSKEKRMEQEIALMKKNVADAMQAYSKIRNRVVELEQVSFGIFPFVLAVAD